MSKFADVKKQFNDAGVHKSHGRRIDRDEARKHDVVVEELEANQSLQEAAQDADYLAILVPHTTILKILATQRPALEAAMRTPRIHIF